MTAESQDDEFRKLWRAIRELQSASPLENSAVRGGRLRFIGGLLLIDSGGTLTVIGHFNGSGDFEWSGPWRFDSGDGTIAGDVTLAGDFALTGKLTSGNVRIEDGKVYVGAGGSQIVIDGATGKINVGGTQIVIDGATGKITAGSGSSQVVIDGSTGKIEAGDLTIDPDEGGGAIVFANGTQLYSNATANQIEMFSGGSHVTVRSNQVTIGAGGTSEGLIIDSTGIRFLNIGTYSATTAGVPVGTLRQIGSGPVQRAS